MNVHYGVRRRVAALDGENFESRRVHNANESPMQNMQSGDTSPHSISSPEKRRRLPSLDSLRGLFIVLMVVEHARQMLTGVIFHEAWHTQTHAPDLLSHYIRMVSHIAAPGFFLLMGMGVVLKMRAGAGISHFVQRGCFLIVLQILENVGWALSMPGGFSALSGTHYFGVLFALGAAMMLCAALARLPGVWLAWIAAFFVLSPYLIPHDGANFWTGLLAHGLHEGHILVNYPVLPWMGMALPGIVLMRRFIADNPVCISFSPVARVVWIFPVALLAAYYLPLFSMRPAFYKYPPTLLFTLAMFTAAFLLLELFQRFPALDFSFLQRLGRNSLAIYLLHIFILALLARLLAPLPPWQVLCLATGLLAALYGFFTWHEKSRMGEVLNAETPGRNTFTLLAPGYDGFMRCFGFYHAEALKKLLPAGLPTPRALLDVAGGTGYIAAQLAPDFQRVVVLDPSPGMLAKARRKGLETVQGEALDLPFPDASFEVVLCTDALHHIKAADRAIAEMARVVKPGGVVLIQEFHIRGFAGWCFFIFERLFIDRSRFIKPGRLQSMMARHGLATETHPVSHLEYICVGRKPSEENNHMNSIFKIKGFEPRMNTNQHECVSHMKLIRVDSCSFVVQNLFNLRVSV